MVNVIRKKYVYASQECMRREGEMVVWGWTWTWLVTIGHTYCSERCAVTRSWRNKAESWYSNAYQNEQLMIFKQKLVGDLVAIHLLTLNIHA